MNYTQTALLLNKSGRGETDSAEGQFSMACAATLREQIRLTANAAPASAKALIARKDS